MTGRIDLSKKPWIALRLRRRRLELNLSPTDVAAAKGPSPRSVSDIERGSRDRVYEATLLALCAALKIDYEQELLAPPTEEELVACGLKPALAGDGPARAGREQPARTPAHPREGGVAPAARSGRGVRWWLAWGAGALALVVLVVAGVGLYERTFGAVYVHRTPQCVELIRGPSGRVVKAWCYNGGVLSCRELNWAGERRLVYTTGCAPDEDGQVYVRALPSGKLLWSDRVDERDIARVFGDDMGDEGFMRCERFTLGDIDGDGTPELIVSYAHQRYYPFCIRVYEPDGRVAGEYYNRGVLYTVVAADIDGDGKDEILAGGTNNGYNGATLILLDDTHCHGASADSLVMADCPLPDSSLVRLVWPDWPDRYKKALGMVSGHASRLEILKVEAFRTASGTSRIRADVTQGHADKAIIVDLDADLHPLTFEIPDSFLPTVEAMPDSLRQAFTRPFLDTWIHSAHRFGSGAAGAGGAVASGPQEPVQVPRTMPDVDNHNTQTSQPKH